MHQPRRGTCAQLAVGTILGGQSSRIAKRTICWLEPLEARDCPATLTWLGGVSGDWSDGANWLGGSGAAPTSADNVIFGDGVHNADCFFADGASGNLAAASITLTADYTGTLEVLNPLMTSQLNLNGGTIDQPTEDGPSDIFTDTFNWTDGILNSTAALASVIIQQAGFAEFLGGAKETGSNVILKGDTTGRLHV